jgi:rod shape-determining protein MreD
MPALASGVARRFAVALPPLMVVLALFVEAIPTGLDHFADVRPLLALSCVYYWSIYRPDLVTAPFVFCAGLLSDLLLAGPLGLMTMVFIGLHAFCVSQRRVLISRSFAVSWSAFVLVALGVAALECFVVTAYYVRFVDPRPLAVQFSLTIALYPVLNWLCNRVEQVVDRSA